MLEEVGGVRGRDLGPSALVALAVLVVVPLLWVAAPEASVASVVSVVLAGRSCCRDRPVAVEVGRGGTPLAAAVALCVSVPVAATVLGVAVMAPAPAAVVGMGRVNVVAAAAAAVFSARAPGRREGGRGCQ